MEKNLSRAGNAFKTLTAVIVTVILMLAVKKATAHTVVYYTPPCFVQGANVTVAVKVIYAASGSYYHWQYRSTAGGSWVWLSNGNNTINGRTFSVSNASVRSTVADYTPSLSINNVGSPAYTTQLDNVELRVIMTDGLDPQYNPFPATAAWGGEEFYNAYEAKYVRLISKPATEGCYSNCSGNALVTNPANPSPALYDYFGGFETGTGAADDNFSAPGTHGSTAKAASDITKWSGGAVGTSPRYRIVNNADSVNTAFAAFAPHSGKQMLVVSNNNNAANRIWYRTITSSSVFSGQVVFKAWFAKVTAANACVVMEVKGATSQSGTVAAFAGNTVSTTLTGAAGSWVQLTMNITVPISSLYQKLEFSIRNCSSASTSMAIDDICLVQPMAGILPVTMLPLQASYTDGISRLTWATASEINSNYFEVEHSVNGTQFTTIGKVAATGSGNRQTAYRFDDVKADAGVNYYRLRAVDKDGSFTYSNTVMVKVTVKGFFVTAVYPAPFTTQVNISISSENSGKALIRLSDLTGRQVALQTVNINKGVSTAVLNNLGSLTSGMYLVEVNCNGNRYTQKIMK
jgi:Secretion system C-terminal sorting domain